MLNNFGSAATFSLPQKIRTKATCARDWARSAFRVREGALGVDAQQIEGCSKDLLGRDRIVLNISGVLIRSSDNMAAAHPTARVNLRICS